MKEIKVPFIQSDNLTSQLKAFYETFRQFKFGEKVEFNLNSLAWACPLLVLPLATYINKTDSNYQIGDTHKIKSYLDIVGFPKGVQSVSEWQKKKSYIPIGLLKGNEALKKERLEGCFTDMIYKIFEDEKVEGISNAIRWPISELVTNIFEHSKENEGYIFGQYYKNKNYLDLCIVDMGRGLANSYKDEAGLDVSHERAIIEAMDGVSTKPDKHERGRGLGTSKRLICEGLGGGFVLLSGDSVLVSNGKQEIITKLDGFHWQGVLIAYRMPKISKPIDIYKYNY